MRAVVIHGFGGPEVLRVIDAPVPPPARGQVLIRVEAATVNPADLATRSGALTEGGLVPPREVLGLGWDVAGVVERTGPGVGGLRPGDRVIGLSDRLDVPLGTQAEYVVLDADAVAPAPAGASAAEAATLPLNGLTAAQALDHLDLTEGRTLLVTGAAGAVGGFAVQLAAARGLRVVAVAGARDEDLVRDLGATEFVPRPARPGEATGPQVPERADGGSVPGGARPGEATGPQSPERADGGSVPGEATRDLAPEQTGAASAPPAERLGEAVRALVPGGVDAALDAALVGVAALDAVRSRGAFVAVAGGAAPSPLRGIRVVNQWIHADGDRLRDLAGLAEAGVLTLRVADTLPLERVADAHRRLETGGLRGRLVLTP